MYRSKDPSTHERVRFDTKGPSRTIQSAEPESNINNIMARYGKGGPIPVMRPGSYIDASAGLDYHAAMTVVSEANQAFEALPAAVRREFHNDPQEMVAFVQEESNRDRAVELGLIDPAPPEPEQPAPSPPEPPSE